MWKEQLLKRLKSLGWRAGVAAAIVAIAYTLDSMEALHVPMWLQAVLSLLGGEATKWLSNNKKMFGSALKFTEDEF